MFFKDDSSKVEKALLEAIGQSMAVIHFTPDGTILEANENFLNALGYRLEEIKGKHHSMFVEDSYRSTAEYKDFWRKLGAGETQIAEYKRIRKNGDEIWINATYNSVKDSSGNVIRVIKVASDITKEVAARREVALLSLVANETDNSVIITDADQRIEYVNPGFTKMTGYTAEEVKGKVPGAVLQGPLTSATTRQEIRTALAAGKPIYTEILNYHKDGSSYWVSLAINPIIAANGKVERFISIQSNVNETKLKAIESSSQIEAMSRVQAVITFKTDGTIISANQNFLDAMGYTLPEIQGRHHRMFVAPEEASSPAYKAFWEKLAAGNYEARVFKRFKKNGEEIWIQASYNPIADLSGKPAKVIKYATDITRVMQAGSIAEEAVANTQSVAAAIEEMSASVSEISRNMALSREAAEGILGDTRKSNEAAEQLTGSMKTMENIVQLINGIAGQVNLLALNATIEAARAGDAGKGFAVVAAEVKNLANQTTKATEDISKQIQELQAVAVNVADSVKNIASSADNVNQYVTGTASAVEEQSAVNREISGNTQKMAVSVQDIAHRIKQLSQGDA